MEHDLLKQLDACEESILFAKDYENLIDAWNNCQKGDWMLWFATKIFIDDKKMLLARALCANTVRHFMKYEKMMLALDTAIGYANDKFTFEEFDNARKNAFGPYYENVILTPADLAAKSAIDIVDFNFNSNYNRRNTKTACSIMLYISNHVDIINPDVINKKHSDICREILTDAVVKKLNDIQLQPCRTNLK
jgi:hypothetical protein